MVPALLFSALLLGQATPAASPAAPPALPKAKDELVCRNEPDPGSRLTHKVCQTRAQMNDRRWQDRAAVDRLQQSAGGPSPGMMMGPNQ